MSKIKLFPEKGVKNKQVLLPGEVLTGSDNKNSAITKVVNGDTDTVYLAPENNSQNGKGKEVVVTTKEAILNAVEEAVTKNRRYQETKTALEIFGTGLIPAVIMFFLGGPAAEVFFAFAGGSAIGTVLWNGCSSIFAGEQKQEEMLKISNISNNHITEEVSNKVGFLGVGSLVRSSYERILGRKGT